MRYKLKKIFKKNWEKKFTKNFIKQMYIHTVLCHKYYEYIHITFKFMYLHMYKKLINMFLSVKAYFIKIMLNIKQISHSLL